VTSHAQPTAARKSNPAGAAFRRLLPSWHTPNLKRSEPGQCIGPRRPLEDNPMSDGQAGHAGIVIGLRSSRCVRSGLTQGGDVQDGCLALIGAKLGSTDRAPGSGRGDSESPRWRRSPVRWRQSDGAAGGWNRIRLSVMCMRLPSPGSSLHQRGMLRARFSESCHCWGLD
jgi:hypothetical protein